MNRKQKRALKKHLSKTATEKITEKLSQFGNLPDECLACLEPFDKDDKSMAMTWNVVVRDNNTVRLYCPTCWEMAQDAVIKFKEEAERELQSKKEKEDAS